MGSSPFLFPLLLSSSSLLDRSSLDTLSSSLPLLLSFFSCLPCCLFSPHTSLWPTVILLLPFHCGLGAFCLRVFISFAFSPWPSVTVLFSTSPLSYLPPFLLHSLLLPLLYLLLPHPHLALPAWHRHAAGYQQPLRLRLRISGRGVCGLH